MLLVGQTDSIVEALLSRTLPSFVLTLVAFLLFWFFTYRGTGTGPSTLHTGKHGGGRYTLGKL